VQTTQVMPTKHEAEKCVAKTTSAAIILKIFFHLPDGFLEECLLSLVVVILNLKF
jgi:hypothetical protein